jgi:hypothetical protein
MARQLTSTLGISNMSKETMLEAISQDKVEFIAEFVHNTNMRYCLALGDNTQVIWEEAPEWQKASVVSGVKFHLSSNMEQNPESTHSNWMKDKEADGWVHGYTKDPDLKTHPCMVPYEKLPEAQKFKDTLFAMSILVAYSSLI